VKKQEKNYKCHPSRTGLQREMVGHMDDSGVYRSSLECSPTGRTNRGCQRENHINQSSWKGNSAYCMECRRRNST